MKIIQITIKKKGSNVRISAHKGLWDRQFYATLVSPEKVQAEVNEIIKKVQETDFNP